MTNRIANPAWYIGVGLAFLTTIQAESFAIPPEQAVSTIADLMTTPRDQAALRKPIRVRGTVSLVGDGISSPNHRLKAAMSFCVEDASAGIWVRSGHALREGILQEADIVLPKLEYGVEIEMEGYLDTGAFAPVIMPTRITILGKRELPDAPHAVLASFLNGGDDIRRVTVNGVVQDLESESDNWWSLRVETGVGHFLTRLPREAPFAPHRLLDAEVEITGLAAVSRNWRSEFVCPRLIVNHRNDVRIRRPAPADPFTVEKVQIDNLDGYSITGRPRHRRRIEGTVTYYDGNLSLYVQDNELGIHVQINEQASIEVGDRIEVSGFIDTTRYLAGLRGASLRRLERHKNLIPIPMTVAQIFQEHQGLHERQPATESCDGQLIQLSGRLLDFQFGHTPKPHRLEIDCGDYVVTAFLSGETKELMPGTDLTVTGIAKLVFPPPIATAKLAVPDRVDLLLRDANDIAILNLPSWWTPQRTFTALLIVAVFALSAFLWAFTLRRTLSQQIDQLAREMRNRHDAALEFQGAIRERTRLAANLHDTLLQTMAGIAYQLEACGQSEQPEPKAFQSHLDTASRMIQRGQDDLRNTVWALHCLPLADGTFADSVKQVTQEIGLGHDTNVTVTCADDFPSLADFIAGNLLLVIQESIHNAIKHADAARIDIDLNVSPENDRVSVSILDTGVGFDVNSRRTSSDGHFGIEGMEQRIERLGGTLVIESQHGVGTIIKAVIPLREFDPKIA
ncbi:MAG: sensor histidine kinase [Rubripirellula sp.]